jgi:luciferase family oxidoreductase group 1
MTTHALQRDRSRAMPDDFPQQLAELLAYYEDTIPVSSPLARLSKVLPGRPETPSPWLLGSSPQSAVWAAELGLPYAFADFINPAGAEIASLYRRDFADGVRLDAPQTVVAVWALAADSEEEAIRLSTSSRMAFTMLRRGRLIAVPPPDVAERFLASEGNGVAPRRRTIVGTGAQVRSGIEAAAREYGAEEVIVVTITFDHEARKRSYELIASEFGLASAVDLTDHRLAEAGERQAG